VQLCPALQESFGEFGVFVQGGIEEAPRSGVRSANVALESAAPLTEVRGLHLPQRRDSSRGNRGMGRAAVLTSRTPPASGKPAYVPGNIFGCGEQKGARRKKLGRPPLAGRLRSE
jgi:hypothetical protein